MTPSILRVTGMLSAAVCALIALGASSPSADSSIVSMTYLKTYSSGEQVQIYQGVPATIRVLFVPTGGIPTTVQLIAPIGGSTAGISTSIVPQTMGAGSVEILIDPRCPPGSSPTNPFNLCAVPGDYVVTGLFGSFGVRINPRGSVTSIAHASGGTPVSSSKSLANVISALVGQPVTLTVTGTNLQNARISSGFATIGSIQAATVGILSQSATTMSIKVTPLKGFQLKLDANEIFAGSLDHSICAAACGYSGSSSLTIQAEINNVLTKASPLVVDANGTVTASGHNLAPANYSVELRYVRKFVGGFATGTVSVTNTSATFSAPGDAKPDSIFLAYTSTSTSPLNEALRRPMLPLPLPLYVRQTPTVTRTDSTLAPFANSARVIFQDSIKIRGRHLLSTADVFPAGTPGVTRDLTAVTFAGQNLTVRRVRASQFAFASGAAADDELVANAPTGGQQFGSLTITTSGGSVTLPNVAFVPRPAVTALQEEGAPGQRVTLPSGSTLRRDRTYFVVGSSLSTTSGPNSSIRPLVALGGGIRDTASSNNQPLTEVHFQFPSSFTSTSTTGPLTISNFGGSTVVGTYTLTAPFQLPAVSGISAAPNPVLGGAPVTATIAFASAITPGADTGFIDIVPASTGTQVIAPISRIPVLTNPLVVSVPTQTTSTTRSVTLTARHSAASASPGTSQATTTVNVQPLEVVSLSLDRTTTSGGRSVNATVALNGNGGGTSVQVLSSNAGVASVPTSVPVKGQSATFSVNVNVVNVVTPVSISVALGGVTQTQTLTVTPPVVQSLTLAKTSFPTFDTTSATITLDAVPIAPVTVNLVVSDTNAVKGVNASVVLVTQTRSISLRAGIVAQATTVTISAQTSGTTLSQNLQVTPLSMSMTLSPATTTAGGSVTATVTLSAPVSPPGNVIFSRQITSSDTSVVSNAALSAISGARFANGQTVVVFSVPTVAPQAQQKTATITYRLKLVNVPSGFDALLPSVSATLAVNP